MCQQGGTSGGWRTSAGAFLLVSVIFLAGMAGGGAAASDGVRTVYVSDGTIHAVGDGGTTTDFGVQAEIVGQGRDFDGDGSVEVPFVDGSGTLGLAESDGDVRTFANSAASSKTAIASGDFDGDGSPAVFYANTSDNGYVYRVQAEGTPTRVTATATNGVSGVADFDGDGEEELVFAGSSSTIKYVDGDSVESTGYSSIGSNNGYGLGPVSDFDGDGVARVPVVDGSNNPALIASDGGKTVPDSNYQSAAKSPVGAADWTGGSSLELLFRNTDGKLRAIDLNGSVAAITGPNGGDISTAPNPGVATMSPPPAPDISEFNASNPTGRTVRVAFDSDTRLDSVSVRVEGNRTNETLDTAAFNATGSGPYTVHG